MVTEGQKQRGFKLTEKDVRSAASLFLEELLESRIDKEFKGHRRIRRIRTGPETEKLCILKGDSEISVTRSQTLPSNYRELSDSDIKQKNVEESQETIQQEVNPQSVDSSGSSADAEDNLSNISENRKKKSFMKRARERLRYAFHRNHNKENATSKETIDKSHSEKQKSKNTGRSINESQQHAKALNGGRVAGGTEELNYVDKDGFGQGELQSAKKWNSNIFSSFRHPKKSRKAAGDSKFQKRTESKDHGQGNGHIAGDKSVPGKVVPPSSLQIQNRTQVEPSLPEQISRSQQDSSNSPKQPVLQAPGHYHLKSESLASSNGTPLSLPGAPISTDGSFIFSGRNAVSAASDSPLHPDIRYRNLILNTSQSIYSNVLDSPGEDIEFIDAPDIKSRDESGKGSYSKQVQNSAGLYQFQTGHPKDNLFVDGSHLTDAEGDSQAVLLRRHGGGIEAATVARARSVVVPDETAEEEYDELDGIFDEPGNGAQPDQSREVVYSVIAQRLIEMGDSFSSTASDQRSTSEGPESKQQLSPLETDIINCLRSVGDNMTRQSNQEMYHRFQSTVQNTFQGEISWNHLALLFYTTKNVVSVVGKGSRAAVLVKDLTVQFVSDSCASWIIDQVGCEILLSSEESDFGPD